MNAPNRIVVLCPAWTRPAGGVRKLYRHVDVLNGQGTSAVLAHREAGFRCQWFENSTVVAYPPEIWPPRRGDLLVVPEMLAWEVLGLTPGVPKVIFNQNPYETFMGKSAANKVVPYMHRDVLATLVVSEPSAEYLKYAFPKHPVFRIRNSIDPALFEFQGDKKRQIAYMPRKGIYDDRQLIELLNCRGVTGKFEMIAIENRTAAQAAAILRKSMIFVSFSSQEGFGLPPLEAMACGCVVIGYHGEGGREYFREPYAIPIAQQDVTALAREVERVAAEFLDDPRAWLDRTRQASEFALGSYSPENEERDIASAWQGILALQRGGK